MRFRREYFREASSRPKVEIPNPKSENTRNQKSETALVPDKLREKEAEVRAPAE